MPNDTKKHRRKDYEALRARHRRGWHRPKADAAAKIENKHGWGMVNMWFDGQRQPNTLYVANTSRGKDSTAMLRAIQLMDWPLDMICSVDIWFDADTPAELPPMVAFKDEYDRKVLDWFGIPVTRLCATQRERERERERERAA